MNHVMTMRNDLKRDCICRTVCVCSALLLCNYYYHYYSYLMIIYFMKTWLIPVTQCKGLNCENVYSTSTCLVLLFRSVPDLR